LDDDDEGTGGRVGRGTGRGKDRRRSEKWEEVFVGGAALEGGTASSNSSWSVFGRAYAGDCSFSGVRGSDELEEEEDLGLEGSSAGQMGWEEVE